LRWLVLVILLATSVYAGLVILPGMVLRETQKDPEDNQHLPVKEYAFRDPANMGAWEEKALARKKTVYKLSTFMDKPCVMGASEMSASAFYVKQPLEHERWPYISWDWAVGEFPAHHDKESLDNKKEFDFPAQVYVVFYAKFILNSKAIQYVWAKDIPQGAVGENPYTKNVKTMVLESGSFEGWKHEERNIRDDYKLLFGEDLSRDIVGVGFMASSDNTKTSSKGYFTNLSMGYLGKAPGDGKKGAEDSRVNWFSGMFLKNRNNDDQG
jgi:hypothetical protein